MESKSLFPLRSSEVPIKAGPSLSSRTALRFFVPGLPDLPTTEATSATALTATSCAATASSRIASRFFRLTMAARSTMVLGAAVTGSSPIETT
jgi:hypothetical protein